MQIGRRTSRQRVVGLSILVLASVLLLLGALAAPTTEGLVLGTRTHNGSALVGNRNEAFVFVSAYNSAGSIRGLLSGSLSATVVAAPENAAPIKKASFTEVSSGVYKIGFAPELSQHKWSAGKYVIAISLTSANGSGVVLAEVLVGS